MYDKYSIYDETDPILIEIISRVEEEAFAKIPHEPMTPEKLEKLAEQRDRELKKKYGIFYPVYNLYSRIHFKWITRKI